MSLKDTQYSLKLNGDKEPRASQTGTATEHRADLVSSDMLLHTWMQKQVLSSTDHEKKKKKNVDKSVSNTPNVRDLISKNHKSQ